MKIIKYFVLVLILFIVSLSSFVGILYYTGSDPSLDDPDEFASVIFNSDKYTVKKVIIEQNKEIDELKNTIKSLESKLDSTNRVINDRVADITKRDGDIAEYKNQIEIYKQNVELEKKNNISVKEMAKTYEGMKVTEIQDIIRQLDDQTILKIYKNTGTRKRQNLLIALGEEAAARITEKVIKDNLTITEKDQLLLKEQIKELETDNYNKQTIIDSLSISMQQLQESLSNLVENDTETDNMLNSKNMKNK